MRTTTLFLACVAALAGCSTVKGPQDTALTIVRPVDQSMEQGETNAIKIMIQRKDFSRDVPVKFEDLPSGVKVVEKDLTIPADDTSKTFTLYADDDAKPVSNHEVLVTVKGPDGIQASEVFRLTVKERA
jgi:hypothetical protein